MTLGVWPNNMDSLIVSNNLSSLTIYPHITNPRDMTLHDKLGNFCTTTGGINNVWLNGKGIDCNIKNLRSPYNLTIPQIIYMWTKLLNLVRGKDLTLIPIAMAVFNFTSLPNLKEPSLLSLTKIMGTLLDEAKLGKCFVSHRGLQSEATSTAC